MAMVFKRRQIVGFLVFLAIVATGVVFVARNWASVGREGLTGATLVAADAPLRTAPAASRSAAAAGPASPSVDYFATAHLRRAQAESRELDQLQHLAGDAQAGATVRAEAEQQILQMEQSQAAEATAELVLQAKGYPQSLVMLSPSGATVVVGAARFDATDAARVGQAVAQVAGLDPAQVQIVPRGAAPA